MKNKKGITLVSLIVTIVVMGILLSVTVIYSSDLMQKSKMTDYIGYMKLVKARADVVLEEDYFNGNEVTGVEIVKTQVENIIGNIGEEWNNCIFVKWYADDIAKQGIDKTILENTNYFVIVFDKDSKKTVDVIYSQGCELEEVTYYTLTSMEEAI